MKNKIIVKLTLGRFDSNHDRELWTEECYHRRGQQLQPWNNQEQEDFHQH